MNAEHSQPLAADPSIVAPRLSVVLAMLDCRQRIPRAMASILAQDLPAEEYEVIAVVDASAETAEYLRSLRPACALRIIEHSNRGLAAALNQGVAAACGSIVLFTDDDIVLHPSNFRAHLDAHQTEDSLVVYGPAFVSEESTDTLATEFARRELVEEIKRCQSGWTWQDDAKVGPNYSVPRARLFAADGYDEQFLSLCRKELGVRLAKMGLRFLYEPKAISHQVHEKTARQLMSIARGRGKEEVLVLHKHPDLRPYSTLAAFADAPPWKWLAYQAAARSPVSPDFVLRPAFALAGSLRAWFPMRQLGLRLLRARIANSFLRGAVKSLGWPRLQAEVGKRLPVLMYHHVGPPQPNPEPVLFVSAARFESQMRFLAQRGYVGIRATDWLSWLQHGTPLPEKPMLLTFDDAIEDLNDHVFPVLERYGFSAVVFVVTNCIGQGNHWNSPQGFMWRPCLTAEQIRHWSKNGIEFGAHSRNHPNLIAIGEPELQDEVAGSRSDLEKLLGFPVVSFAYPYGACDDAAAKCVQQHFDLGFTIETGLNTLRTGRCRLHRNIVFDWDTKLELEFLVRMGWNPIRKLRGAVRLRSRLSAALRRFSTLKD